MASLLELLCTVCCCPAARPLRSRPVFPSDVLRLLRPLCAPAGPAVVPVGSDPQYCLDAWEANPNPNAPAPAGCNRWPPRAYNELCVPPEFLQNREVG